MAKITHGPAEKVSQKLTERTDAPFIISFRRKLQEGYRFTGLQKRDLVKFQNFLDKVSQCTVSQVDALCKRPSDANDAVGSQQVVHYECSDSFRLHGVYESGRFEVLRIDPHHRYHS